MKPLGVGILGLGTVGSGVARLLIEQHERIERRAGRSVRIVAAAVRDADRARGLSDAAFPIITQPNKVVHDPAVDVVVELIGGTEPARSLTLDALRAGKSVVTANKALLAEHGQALFAAAREAGQPVAFEASVGGGIPIVQAISIGLAANQIQWLSAIVNGTCNYVLTSMSNDGVSYAEALRRAQALGYAEADPTLDVDGTDTSHKLAVLAQIAFGATVTTADIPKRGIDQLQAADIRYASELGYTVKLLARARLVADGALVLRVAPRLVRDGTPLADVRGAYNAIRVGGDVVGDTLFYGRGAGQMPTASAVVADLIDVASGRAARAFAVQNFWNGETKTPRLAAPHEVRERSYLRFTIADRPGVIGQIAQVLGQHNISIASVIQHDPGDDDHPDSPVALILMTHAAPESDLRDAVDEIDRLDVVRAPSVWLGVEE